MAERLPVGAARNSKSPPISSLSSTLKSTDVSNSSIDQFNDQIPNYLTDSTGLKGFVLSNRSATPSNRSPVQSRVVSSEATRNGNRARDGEARSENEWVEQDEPGVYITFVTLPGGIKDLKRVRFSRKRFSEKQAETRWAENRARVDEHHNVQAADKSSVGVESEALAH